MNRRIVAAAMASVLSLSAAGSLHAAPLSVFGQPAADNVTKVKMVSFNVRNDSKQSLVLEAGGQQITIEPGKSAVLKVGEGTDVVNVSGTSHVAAGSVVTKVTKDLQGNTLAIS
jgi:hypothetical protein